MGFFENIALKAMTSILDKNFKFFFIIFCQLYSGLRVHVEPFSLNTVNHLLLLCRLVEEGEKFFFFFCTKSIKN